MELIRGLQNLKPEHRGCVATIGNFDGVHLGHQAVFSALRSKGEALSLPSLVIVFEPQPAEYFHAVQTPARLTRLREKLEIITTLDIDRVLVLEFNSKLAAMPANEFVEQILVNRLDIAHLYVGDDFRFGKNRVGDFQYLQDAGATHGFSVASMETIVHGQDRISSTRIRVALSNGELDEAARSLGRPYHICGRVGHGHKRGRKLNFPTIKIYLHLSLIHI